jgi:hypothetical protein
LWVVVACSAAIFCSFGLFVSPNATVVVAFVVAALAVSAAMFLIVDLGDPFAASSICRARRRGPRLSSWENEAGASSLRLPNHFLKHLLAPPLGRAFAGKG